MNKEFVMRGQTASGLTEILNFSGLTPGYAYRLVEFELYPSTNLGGNNVELHASITAGKTAIAPTDVNFNDDGLIGTSTYSTTFTGAYASFVNRVINDTFLITQDLILMVIDTDGGDPINWQCRFVAEKLVNGEEALANYNQFTISNG